MTRAVKASDPLVQQRTVNTRTSCAPTPCLRSRESLAATGLLSVKPASPARSVSRQALMDSFLSRCMDLATSVPTVPPAVAIPVAGVLAMWMLAWADAKRLTSKPKLTYQSTKFNEGILSRIPTLRSPYKPLPFLTNGHVETIFAAKARKKVDIEYRRENLHMPDGGVVSLDWRVPKEGDLPLADDAPVLILLPGLTGGSDDSYVRYAVHYAESHGTRAVVFNSRGCGDTFLTTPRFYSGLYIGDMQRVADAVRLRYPRSQLFAAGWSLGANILVNYLGLVGEDTPIDGAAALCNPFDLSLGSKNLQRGFNKVYSKNLGGAMSRIMQRNRKVWNGVGGDFDVEGACNASSVWAWDDAITRVSFGFKTVEQYYAAAGSHQRVHGVRVPLLVIQAEDDPIAPIAGTPFKALHDNPNCILAVTQTGGHLGWVSGGGGYFGEPWTDRVITEWLLSLQVQTANDAARSLLGQSGSQLPKPPRNFSVSEGLAGGDGSGSSVDNAALRLDGVLDPVWSQSPLVAEPFDGVRLSPSQTGYDPAERVLYAKTVSRQRSAYRACSAGSARGAPQQRTPPRLPPVSPPAPGNGSGHGSTAPYTEPVQCAPASTAPVAPPKPALADASTHAGAAPAVLETGVQSNSQSAAARGSVAVGEGLHEEVGHAFAAGPQPIVDRPGHGSVRFAASGLSGSRESDDPADGLSGEHGIEVVGGPDSPVRGAVRGANGAARIPPLQKPASVASIDVGKSASGNLRKLAGGAACEEHDGEASGVVVGAGEVDGRRAQEFSRWAMADPVGDGRRDSRAGQVARRIGDPGTDGTNTGTGEAHMRAGRAVATFVGATWGDAVMNAAWRESVVSGISGSQTDRGNSNSSAAEESLAKVGLTQSLLANNAEALEAIANGRAGSPLQARERQNVIQQLKEAPVGSQIAAMEESVPMEGPATVAVTGRSAPDRQSSSQGFFVDVDPTEYRDLTHGFGEAVISRPPDSVTSQSASSQGVWWNR